MARLRAEMSNKPRYLITTADERTWKLDEPVLWLGEWCRIYTRRNVWQAMDGKLLEYHWNDRDRFENDYHYLNVLYEKTLASLAAQLNTIHETQHSLRYWRILLGPWLATFSHILYDRWLSIQSAVEQYKIAGTLLLPQASNYFSPPNDMVDFLHLIRGDEWNSRVYAEVIKRFTSIPVFGGISAPAMPENNYESTPIDSSGRRGLRVRVTGSMRAVALWMTKKFGRDTDIFINTPYLTKRTFFRLFLRLRQIPVIWNPIPVPRADVDMGQRAWSLKQTASSDFERLFLEMLPSQLPRFCLEGYRQLLTRTREQPWPGKPRLLYSAHVLWHDVISMGYFAEKTEQGVPLLYGQHGGVYGTAKFQFAREHEGKVANGYLVWGRGGVGCSHEHNVGITKLDGPHPGPFDRHRQFLFVTLNTSRYTYRLCSESARNFLADLEGSFAMISALRSDVQKASLVRLLPSELGWNLQERWRDRFPGISLDPGFADIYKLMRTSRLVAFNYNQTGFLETLAMGIPTILLCDFRKYPLKEEAIPFYDALQKVGICHATPESAANHINAVWDNVDAWWTMAEVQEALSMFRCQYCDLTGDLLGRVLERINKDVLI